MDAADSAFGARLGLVSREELADVLRIVMATESNVDIDGVQMRERLGSKVAYKPVETEGTRRVAELIAPLILSR